MSEVKENTEFLESEKAGDSEERGSEKGENLERSGRVGMVVVWVSIGLGLVLGFFLFKRVEWGVTYLREWKERFKVEGRRLTLEGCAERMFQWVRNCRMIRAMCRDSIPELMAACVEAKPRREECEKLDLGRSEAHFTYSRCREKKMTYGRNWQKECGRIYAVMRRNCTYWRGGGKDRGKRPL